MKVIFQGKESYLSPQSIWTWTEREKINGNEIVRSRYSGGDPIEGIPPSKKREVVGQVPAPPFLLVKYSHEQTCSWEGKFLSLSIVREGGHEFLGSWSYSEHPEGAYGGPCCEWDPETNQFRCHAEEILHDIESIYNFLLSKEEVEEEEIRNFLLSLKMEVNKNESVD